jgi:hypothetical protein
MKQVQNRVEKHDPGTTIQSLEAEIVDNLTELVLSLKKRH